jgi:hypothetical protein
MIQTVAELESEPVLLLDPELTAALATLRAQLDASAERDAFDDLRTPLGRLLD